MSTQAFHGTDGAPRDVDGRAGRLRGTFRRVWSLTRAEVTLLSRNRTALLVALVFPVLSVLALLTFDLEEGDAAGTGALTVIMFVGVALLYIVYYNLVSTYVARREDLVLKRLRTGELSDPEILAGAAMPAVLLAAGQIAVAVGAALTFLDLEAPVNVVLVAGAVVGGVVLFALLAAATTKITRNAEMAQMSTMPVFIVCLIFSGMVAPLDAFSDRVADIAQFVPLTPVIDLTRLGLLGTTGTEPAVGFTESFAEAVTPAAILALWIAIGYAATRRWFRWEPRR
ncbi:ABC transporter permease [Actinobacteria bacterium YIM 96077]|uniref:ABC transporter permease n=1 Tax=Phytoactinopolyspora halophila TaxID=1981511 RepID=A0A329QLS6_9ACTN|nr:ABC transporter permease [Phytoactinopolyspora halophila]AYY13562.1 ABC transporter permease [Actinobacteria bacterium YIM 96077]RAW12382.1 ABC transporter permease [Phytoactinopolyspora halophila]